MAVFKKQSRCTSNLCGCLHTGIGALSKTLSNDNSTGHSLSCGPSVEAVPADAALQPREGASEISQHSPTIRYSTDFEQEDPAPVLVESCETCGPMDGAAVNLSDAPVLPAPASRGTLGTCTKTLQLPFASFKVSSLNFPSLARLFPQPQRLPTGPSNVNSIAPSGVKSNTAVASGLAATSSSARLALSGQPPPYFVLNPDLFEDTSVWTVRRLRQLCSSLHLQAPSRERGDIVQLLKNFHRNDPQADTLVGDTNTMSVYREHSNFLLVPVETIDYPPARGRAVAGHDAASASTLKSILKHKVQEEPAPPAHGTRWASRLRMELREKRFELAEVARPAGETNTRSIQDGAGEMPSQQGRPQERKRLHISIYGEHDAPVNPACKKRIGFSAFNNVQLIDARAVDTTGKALPAHSNIVTDFLLLQRAHDYLQTNDVYFPVTLNMHV